MNGGPFWYDFVFPLSEEINIMTIRVIDPNHMAPHPPPPSAIHSKSCERQIMSELMHEATSAQHKHVVAEEQQAAVYLWLRCSFPTGTLSLSHHF